MWVSKGFLNYFVWTLKMKRAPLISRDFEEILSAPLEIQVFKIINIKRPPNLVPGGALKGGVLIFMPGSILIEWIITVLT